MSACPHCGMCDTDDDADGRFLRCHLCGYAEDLPIFDDGGD